MMYFVSYFMVLLFVFMETEGGVSMHNPFYCYSQDPIKPQMGMFAIHTSYEAVRGQNINANVSTCTPSKFWMISRHGTRLPNVATMTNMLQRNEQLHRDILEYYDQGKTSLCSSDIELLKNWKLDRNITFEQIQFLTSSGWSEMKGLGQRYQAAFPQIFPFNYSPRDYFFRSTGTHRSDRSIHAFADGLFGHEKVILEGVSVPDYVLLPDANCPLYQEVAGVRYEQNAFRKMPEYQEMTSQVSAKLGFHRSHALRNIEFDTIAQICKYEQIINLNSTSALCAALSVANHQVFEYYWDVDVYYRVGYGHLNYRTLFENLDCFLMQDMLRFIQSTDVNDHKVRMFNANIPSLFLFLVTLGAYADDVPLSRHNFAQQAHRSWKASLLCPMGANLAVIRYTCDSDDNDILFLHNEKPLQIPGCQPNGLCKQSFILDRYRRFLNANCVEMFCSNSYETA